MPGRRASASGRATTSAPGSGVAAGLGGVAICLFGAVVLVLGVGHRVTGSMGDGWLTYVPPPAGATGGSGVLWLVVGTVFAPAGGFSTAYLHGPVRWRLPVSVGLLVLFGLEEIFLIWAMWWFVGAERHVDALFGASGGDGSSSVVFVVVFGVVIAAPAIMAWLEAGSDFRERSDAYFDTGSATVRVRGISVRAHLSWLAAVVLVALSFDVQLYVAASRWSDYTPLTLVSQAWGNSTREEVTAGAFGIGVLFGGIAGVTTSLLVAKLLYARTPRSRRGGTAPSRWWRTLVALRHIPITVGVTSVFALVTAPVTPQTSSPLELSTTDLLTLLGTAVVLLLGGLALGCWLINQTWRVRDPREPRARRFSQAGVPRSARSTKAR